MSESNGAAALAMLAAISPLEIVSVAFALAYLVLAVRQNILCWIAALISTLRPTAGSPSLNSFLAVSSSSTTTCWPLSSS